MPRVTHFEIHVEDPERAIAFYQRLFNWEITAWKGAWEYWLITTGPDSQPGINGGMVRRRGPIDGASVNSFVCTVDVASLDESLALATAAGGQVVVPKMAVPGVGFLAYCKDTEGNILGMIQSDHEVA